MDSPSRAQGRVFLLCAAVLWSLGGAFTKFLTEETFLGTNQPPLEPLRWGGYELPVQIAFYRTLFAALALAPFLRRQDLTFRSAMIPMALSFAAMNALFITAMALGTAANAIFLQYSAPLWMYLASVFLLGEKADWRGAVTLAFGLLGIAVIMFGGWEEGEPVVVALGLASGVTYAGVLLSLRFLRNESSRWLTAWNQIWSTLLLLPFVLALAPPTLAQLGVLAAFGSGQLVLAYWLAARGLRVISPQEAGAITLLEPILNPIWAYGVSPQTEVPHLTTYIGGAIILGALAWRYWPRWS
ncbi:MAG: DMT family transporter [Gemmataceae bacterium]|nr:DMT family transporter [Gemmataceae bacterium]MCI0741125.1 DMT family transporter [Gemmataceae bacterium]